MASTRINRKIGGSRAIFSDIFIGFDSVGPIRRTFGKDTKDLLSTLKVRLYKGEGYMWVDQKKGCLVVSVPYLRKGPRRYLYLDAVHELVHIKQMRDGKELFDKKYDYVDRPTEIQAYKAAVAEAKALGMTKKQIEKYLEIEEWMTKAQFKRLCKNVGVD